MNNNKVKPLSDVRFVLNFMVHQTYSLFLGNLNIIIWQFYWIYYTQYKLKPCNSHQCSQLKYAPSSNTFLIRLLRGIKNSFKLFKTFFPVVNNNLIIFTFLNLMSHELFVKLLLNPLFIIGLVICKPNSIRKGF